MQVDVHGLAVLHLPRLAVALCLACAAGCGGDGPAAGTVDAPTPTSSCYTLHELLPNARPAPGQPSVDPDACLGGTTG